MLIFIRDSIIVACIFIIMTLSTNALLTAVIDEIVRDSNSRNTITNVKKESKLFMRLTRICMWNMKTTRPTALKIWILLSSFTCYILCPHCILIVIIMNFTEQRSSLFDAVVIGTLCVIMAVLAVSFCAYYYRDYLFSRRDKYLKSRKRKK